MQTVFCEPPLGPKKILDVEYFVERKHEAREAILKRCGLKPAKNEEEHYFSGGKRSATLNLYLLFVAWSSCLCFRQDCVLSRVCVRAGILGAVTRLCFRMCPCPSVMRLSVLMCSVMDGLQGWQVLPVCLWGCTRSLSWQQPADIPIAQHSLPLSLYLCWSVLPSEWFLQTFWEYVGTMQ